MVAPATVEWDNPIACPNSCAATSSMYTPLAQPDQPKKNLNPPSQKTMSLSTSTPLFVQEYVDAIAPPLASRRKRITFLLSFPVVVSPTCPAYQNRNGAPDCVFQIFIEDCKAVIASLDEMSPFNGFT